MGYSLLLKLTNEQSIINAAVCVMLKVKIRFEIMCTAPKSSSQPPVLPLEMHCVLINC